MEEEGEQKGGQEGSWQWEPRPFPARARARPSPGPSSPSNLEVLRCERYHSFSLRLSLSPFPASPPLSLPSALFLLSLGTARTRSPATSLPFLSGLGRPSSPSPCRPRRYRRGASGGDGRPSSRQVPRRGARRRRSGGGGGRGNASAWSPGPATEGAEEKIGTGGGASNPRRGLDALACPESPGRAVGAPPPPCEAAPLSQPNRP